MRAPTRRQKPIIAVVLMEVISSLLAWRDLSRRNDESIRGSKRFWRVSVVVNPGNSLFYWLFGRR
jgi:hypothetical protein